jgi:hypothetical protein
MTMPNEHEPTKPAENQPAGGTGQQENVSPQPAAPPVVVHPEADWRKRKKAEHEAGHAVVTDDCGWEVLWVNIKAGKPQLTKADWAGFSDEIDQTDWDDPEQREKMKPKVLKYVAICVAGHLAENVIDPKEPKVSDRMPLHVLEAGQNGEADIYRVARFLKLIRCNTIEHVRAAEARAKQILDRRQAHLKALSHILFEQEFVEGDVLKTALGK